MKKLKINSKYEVSKAQQVPSLTGMAAYLGEGTAKVIGAEDAMTVFTWLPPFQRLLRHNFS